MWTYNVHYVKWKIVPWWPLYYVWCIILILNPYDRVSGSARQYLYDAGETLRGLIVSYGGPTVPLQVSRETYVWHIVYRIIRGRVYWRDECNESRINVLQVYIFQIFQIVGLNSRKGQSPGTSNVYKKIYKCSDIIYVVGKSGEILPVI
jgi:hypothetical protein